MEQEVRRERQAAGSAAAKERGIYSGRKQGTTKAKPERAKALREKGCKVKEIASALNVGESYDTATHRTDVTDWMIPERQDA